MVETVSVIKKWKFYGFCMRMKWIFLLQQLL